ncbi:DUF5133 domain-containing protein [Streptomyces sp. NPDC058171]
MAHPAVPSKLVTEHETLRTLDAGHGDPAARRRPDDVASTLCVPTGTRDRTRPWLQPATRRPAPALTDDSLLTAPHPGASRVAASSSTRTPARWRSACGAVGAWDLRVRGQARGLVGGEIFSVPTRAGPQSGESVDEHRDSLLRHRGRSPELLRQPSDRGAASAPGAVHTREPTSTPAGLCCVSCGMSSSRLAHPSWS